MVGTASSTRGGIAAVINAYRSNGLFQRWSVVHIVTHCDGSALRKVAIVTMALVRFTLLLVTRRVALVHLHVASNASFWRKSVFILLALLAGRPVVFHLHGGGFLDFYEKCGAFRQHLVTTILDRVDRIVVVSPSWLGVVKQITSNSQVVVIANPAPSPALSVPERDGQQLLFLGKVCADKGVFELIEAFRAVWDAFPRATLVIGGDGEIARAAAKAESIGVRNVIQFVGWVTGHEKQRLLNESSVFVLPSHAEGMPMTLLEAMAHGLAVIATPIGGICDVVTHGTDGLLVPPREVEPLAAAMHRLLGDANLRMALGEHAKKKIAEQFAPNAVLAKIDNLYCSLGGPMNQRPGPMAELKDKSCVGR